MITCRVYRDGELHKRELSTDQISEFVEDGASRVWLDIVDPKEGDLQMLQEEFHLHELVVEDMRHRDQRPKVDTYEGYHFVVVRPLRLKEDRELEVQEMHLIVGKAYLVTLRYTPLFDLSEAIRRWEQQPKLTDQGGGFFLYGVMDEVVDHYLDIVDVFEDIADDLEDEVFDETPMTSKELNRSDRSIQQGLFVLKRQVVTFRRHAMPLRRVLDVFVEEPQLVTPPLIPYYRDVTEHVIRAAELTDNIRDLLTSLLEVRVAQVANRLNEVMKKLTAWAAIILFPTLIAGIYGMNFRHMPELGWRLGYPFAIASMLFAAGALYVTFKRRGWL